MTASIMTTPAPALSAPAPWICTARTHDATTLGAASLPRWVRVHTGRAWLTRRVRPGDVHAAVPEDVWLDAGQSLALPPGTTWVLETWPGTRLSVVEDGCAVLNSRQSGGVWQRLGSRAPAWRLPRIWARWRAPGWAWA